MTAKAYDIVTVGGGLGGSVLARTMAGHGARVLVIEREKQFRDRVRGEVLAPWGVAEAKRLGIFDALNERFGNELRYWDMHLGPQRVSRRDFRATTPQRTGWLTFFHPDMQQLFLDLAAAAGAEVRRGARVQTVRPGNPPSLAIEQDGRSEEINARLVVGADGRGSAVRKLAGFEARRDPDRLLFAGVLLDPVPSLRDSFHHVINPGMGRLSYIFPQRGTRARVYVGCHKDTLGQRLQGEGGMERFRAEALATGVAPELLADAREIGPLAMFDGAESWVHHPYRAGVALVGDAAATSDPTWGQGMSLTLRDVRVLSDCLAESRDWDAAGHAYAERHDWCFERVHRADGWFADLLMEIGAEADERRARALPLLAQDPLRACDVPISGPESPCDDEARRRFFGED